MGRACVKYLLLYCIFVSFVFFVVKKWAVQIWMRILSEKMTKKELFEKDEIEKKDREMINFLWIFCLVYHRFLPKAMDLDCLKHDFEVL